MSCNICPVGSFSLTGNITCSSCLPGLYQPSANSLTCMPCSAGLFTPSNNSVSCLTCSLGFFSPIRSTNCSICPLGRFTADTASTSLASCLDCPTGFYGNQNRTCIQCAKNTFSNFTGRTSLCDSCPLGQKSPPGSSSIDACQLCDEGQNFTLVNNDIICGNCSINQFGNGRICDWCPNGTYTVGEGKPFRECLSCSEGRYQVGFMTRTCEICPFNTFSGSGWTNCTDCPIGRYTLSPKSSQCMDCPQGSFLSSLNAANRTYALYVLGILFQLKALLRIAHHVLFGR